MRQRLPFGNKNSESTRWGGVIVAEHFWLSKVVKLETDDVKDLLNELIRTIRRSPSESERRFDQAINESMSSIDNRVSEQLSLILQAPESLRVEATLRSLHRLLAEMDNYRASLHVLTVTREELEEEARGSRAPERMTLKRKVWESLEQPDGEPFSLIIADFEFSYTEADVAVLRLLSRVGSSTQAPVVAAASPGLLDLVCWSDLDNLPNLSRQFDKRQYEDWNNLCRTSDAQFLTLVNPRWLLRSTHEVKSAAKASFRFSERVERRDQLCWGNSAYLVALCAVRAFGRFSWTARIEGLDGGGLIEDLPQPAQLEMPDGDSARCGPVETLVPESIEYLLAQKGICSLCAYKGSNRAVFRSVPTLAKPAGGGEFESGVWLPTILAATRVSQHLLRMLQDGLQRRTDPRELEAQANRCLSRYVSCQEPG